MSPPSSPCSVPLVGALRACAALGLALTVATCRDALGPGSTALGRVAVAPVFPSEAALGEFGLTIDAVRFIVVRPAADTIADTTLALPPDATELELDLRVPLIAASETLSVSVVALSGTVPLFEGTSLVPVPSRLPPTVIPLDTYVGPAADSIVIQPRDPFILVDDSLRFQVQGFNAGVPVTQFYVAWSTSDAAVAAVNSFGVLRAPASRASVRVRARTPSGASDSVTATFTLPATQLVLFAGDAQVDTVGDTFVTPLEVQARAADGIGVGGVAVRFRPVNGGGSVTDTLVMTDSTGHARTTVTLGSVIGGQSFEASVAGLAGSPITFNVTAFAGLVTQLVASAGDLQSAVVGTAVATDPAVRALDQFGNPVPGASITFAVSGSGGSVTGPAQLTNGAGVATVGSWTLGTTAGTDTLTATLSGLTPVTFTATALPGAANLIQAIAGGGETVTINTAVTTPPAVQVTDQFGNPVAGATVTFAVASGGGSLGGPGVVPTDGAGIATSPAWTIGTAVGANTLTATGTGLTGSPVTFTATGTAAPASRMVAFAGDGQAALVGNAVSNPPAVQVTDQFGNPIAGVAVTFTSTSGGGGVVGANPVTDASGVATVGSWTLGTAAGPNTLDATAAGLPTVTFTAEGIATTASNIVLIAGDGQTGTVATALGAYSVRVVDVAGAPVAAVPVSWAVPAGSGTIAPAQSTTDVTGIATATRTLGTVAGTQTATASVGGLAGSPVTFSATALPDVPTQLVKQSADPQTATVATSVAAPVVKVADRFGNGVAGVVLDFAATGGGTIGVTRGTSDPSGLVTTGSWTLGSMAGTNTLTATSGTLPVAVFTATGAAGLPAQLAFLTVPVRSLAGDTIAPLVHVAIQDQFGNTVLPAKDSVTLGLGPGGNPAAKLLGTVSVPPFNGVAAFTDVSVDSAGTGYTLVAAAVNLAGARSAPFDIGGVIAAIPVAQLGSVAAAVNPQTGRIYVPGSSAVSVLDGVKNIELTQIVGIEVPFGVALNTKTDRIYVSSAAGVVVIDGPTSTLVPLPILVGTGAKGIAVDEVTNRVFVAVAGDLQTGRPALVSIDGTRDAVAGAVPLPKAGVGVGVAFNPITGLVYVAIPMLQEVAVIDPVKAAVVGEIPLGKGTHGVAVDVRTNLLYVTNRDENTVSVIDAVGLKEIHRVAVGASPEGVGVDPNRGVVYVANSGDPTKVSTTVSLIDGGKLTVFATLVVGPGPKTAAVDPVTGRVYVPTQLDDMVRVIQP